MDDLFVKIRAEVHRGHDDLLIAALATCSRCTLLASSLYAGGNRTFADLQRTSAEDAYQDANRLLTDPTYAQYRTIKSAQEGTKKLETLRGRLDKLERFNEPKHPMENPIQQDVTRRTARAVVLRETL